MSRPLGAHALAVLLAVSPASALAAKKKPPPKTEPKTEPKAEPVPVAPKPSEGATDSTAKPAPEAESKPKAHVELRVCPAESMSEMDAAGLARFIRKRCRTLLVPEDSAPTQEVMSVASDESIVAVCVERNEAVAPKSCALAATVEIPGEPAHKLIPDGDYALVVRTSRLARSLHHGGQFMVIATAGDEKMRSPLVFKKPFEAYGPIGVWMPIPMFTTDFSASPRGYRFGITPLAVALGGKWHPGSSSGYFGFSAFAAWNLLVPNDTQTLSNGTGVRINYKAVGFGGLLDGSGYVGLGLGVGHTFTTDARTDFRAWFYLGPRLLFGLNEW